MPPVSLQEHKGLPEGQLSPAVSPWAAGAAPAVPSPTQPQPGLHEVSPALGGPPTAASPPKPRVFLGELTAKHQKREFCSELSVMVGVGVFAFLLPLPGAGEQPRCPGWC